MLKMFLLNIIFNKLKIMSKYIFCNYAYYNYVPIYLVLRQINDVCWPVGVFL